MKQVQYFQECYREKDWKLKKKKKSKLMCAPMHGKLQYIKSPENVKISILQLECEANSGSVV